MLLASDMFFIEKERGALRKTVYILIFILTSGCLIYLFNLETIALYVIVILAILTVILFIFPFKINKNILDFAPANQYDERDIMFSRKELKQGSENYNNYYNKNPELETLDDQFRQLPGLLSSNAQFYDYTGFKMAKNYEKRVKNLHKNVIALVNPDKTDIPPKEFTEKIKQFVIKAGARDAGICQLQSYHYYSHKGRGLDYGNKISMSHKYGIAFTVEMDHNMVQGAPKAPIVIESCKQYFNAAKIATQLADYIGELGYEARAHIDGNYQVVCPLVARDAGLGEIGRMGLLMTPKLGPRVRIAVVTTNAILNPDEYVKQQDVIDFCSMCLKCAACCPTNSIPKHLPVDENGLKRWKINSEACYTYWCKVGTDCGKCMAVCPYSHPNHILHNLTRWAIKRSGAFRYIAVKMDDFFYGKRPAPKPIPNLSK